MVDPFSVGFAIWIMFFVAIYVPVLLLKFRPKQLRLPARVNRDTVTWTNDPVVLSSKLNTKETTTRISLTLVMANHTIYHRVKMAFLKSLTNRRFSMRIWKRAEKFSVDNHMEIDFADIVVHLSQNLLWNFQQKYFSYWFSKRVACVFTAVFAIDFGGYNWKECL